MKSDVRLAVLFSDFQTRKKDHLISRDWKQMAFRGSCLVSEIS